MTTGTPTRSRLHSADRRRTDSPVGYPLARPDAARAVRDLGGLSRIHLSLRRSIRARRPRLTTRHCACSGVTRAHFPCRQTTMASNCSAPSRIRSSTCSCKTYSPTKTSSTMPWRASTSVSWRAANSVASPASQGSSSMAIPVAASPTANSNLALVSSTTSSPNTTRTTCCSTNPQREVLEQQFDETRLIETLRRLRDTEWVVTQVERPSPLGFPLLIDRIRARMSNQSLLERIAKMKERWGD